MSVNNTNDSPVQCANNGCTFFGRPSTGNFCSKCYNDLKKDDETAPPAVTAKVAVEAEEKEKETEKETEKEKVVEEKEKVKAEEVAEAKKAEEGTSSEKMDQDEEEEEAPKRKEQKNKKRCFSCNKKVGYTGIECRCEYVFCSKHRFPAKHNCDFDYKTFGRKVLEKKHVASKPTSLQDKL